MSGRDRRKATYFALNVEVKRRGMVMICAGSRDEHSRSDGGEMGVRAGQSGRATACGFAVGVTRVFAVLVLDLGGISNKESSLVRY